MPLKTVGKAYLSRKSQTFPVGAANQADSMRAKFPQRKNTISGSS